MEFERVTLNRNQTGKSENLLKRKGVLTRYSKALKRFYHTLQVLDNEWAVCIVLQGIFLKSRVL